MTTAAVTPTSVLIQRIASTGDADATNQLLTIIHTHHLQRAVHHYKGRNRLIDDDDIESEFMLGCLKALAKVRPDVGNPLMYVIWKGRLAVATIFRDRIKRGTQIECGKCPYKGTMAYRAGKPLCPSCGSTWVRTWQREVPSEEFMQEQSEQLDGLAMAEAMSLDELEIEKELWFNRATYEIQIDEIRARLSGRTLELFDIMIGEGISAGSSQNYIKEIAGRWGVTGTSVAASLRRLRKAVLAYYEREGA